MKAKNFFKGVGKALVYFLVYIVLQILVGAVLGTVVTTRLAMSGVTDAAALQAQAVEQILSMTGMMILISGVLTLLVYWIVFLIRKKKFLAEAGVAPMDARGIIWIILLGISLNIVISLVLSIIPFPQSWTEAYAQKSGTVLQGGVFLNWVATVLIAPVVEEIVFRGFVYTRMRKGMPGVVAAAAASLLFAVVHGSIIWGIYTFTYSLVLIWLFERFGSLTASILCHMAFNLAGMVLSVLQNVHSAVVVVICVTAVCVATVAGVAINRLQTPQIKLSAEG